MQLRELEPFKKIFLDIFCDHFPSLRLKFPGKIADKYVENLKQAFGTTQKICQ